MRIVAAFLLSTIAMPAAAETVLVTAARMLDAPVVVVIDGRIASVVTGAGARPVIPAGAKRIDLGDRTLLPGPIDMHVHMTGDPTITPIEWLRRTDSFWTVVGGGTIRRRCWRPASQPCAMSDLATMMTSR